MEVGQKMAKYEEVTVKRFKPQKRWPLGHIHGIHGTDHTSLVGSLEGDSATGQRPNGLWDVVGKVPTQKSHQISSLQWLLHWHSPAASRFSLPTMVARLAARDRTVAKSNC